MCLWRSSELKRQDRIVEGVLSRSCCSEKAAGRRSMVLLLAGVSSHVTCTASGSGPKGAALSTRMENVCAFSASSFVGVCGDVVVVVVVVVDDDATGAGAASITTASAHTFITSCTCCQMT